MKITRAGVEGPVAVRNLEIAFSVNGEISNGIGGFQAILKRTRTIYGYKASELSELLGISKSYLSEIENNKKQPSLELLEKYSEIYDMKLSSLILLSENYEEASKNNKGDKFIRNMMIKLIEKMTPDMEE